LFFRCESAGTSTSSDQLGGRETAKRAQGAGGPAHDEVTGVHVGSTEAVLPNNAFLAVDVLLDDPIVFRTAVGERTFQHSPRRRRT
jgi:hypothetical protein